MQDSRETHRLRDSWIDDDDPFITKDLPGKAKQNVQRSTRAGHNGEQTSNRVGTKRISKEDAIEIIISTIEGQQRIVSDKVGGIWLVIPPKNPRSGSLVVEPSSKEAYAYYNLFYSELMEAKSRLSRNSLKYIAESLNDLPPKRTDVYLRWAMVKNADGSSTLWHDLNREDRIGIKVTSAGWELAPLTEVLFKYNNSAEACPEPVKSNMPFIHFIDKHLRILEPLDRVVLTVGLVSYMLASKQNIITVLKGAAGSGKSTIAKIVGLFLQYKSSPEGLVGASTRFTDDQLMARLANQPYLSFDNMSALSASESDSLCRISTGSELTSRKFYSETGLVTVAGSAPLILSTIGDLGGKPDLRDRAYVFTPKSDRASHKSEDRLWAEIYSDYPAMLGALYDLVSVYLKHIDEARANTNIEHLPRMSEFGLVGVAIAPELQKGEYKFSSILTELNRKRTITAHSSMENDKLRLYLYQLMRGSVEDTITITPKELAEQINKLIKKDDPRSNVNYSHLRLPENLLERQPTLRDSGIEFEIQQGQYAGRAKTIVLRKVDGFLGDNSFTGIQLNNQESEDNTNEQAEEEDYVSWWPNNA